MELTNSEICELADLEQVGHGNIYVSLCLIPADSAEVNDAHVLGSTEPDDLYPRGMTYVAPPDKKQLAVEYESAWEMSTPKPEPEPDVAPRMVLGVSQVKILAGRAAASSTLLQLAPTAPEVHQEQPAEAHLPESVMESQSVAERK